MDQIQVGQYVLEEKLGEGGMAEVWKARNVVLGNYAAIKFLTPRFAGNPEIEQRFLGEGKRQANLQHPNIVSALDFLYVNGRSYLVMRYINGEGLDQRLFRLQAPMPIPAALSISNDVLSALDYAHSEGVIHRDIKPSNILLEHSGRAHVLDFGIALALGEQRVTRAGIAIGTPHYMSPEQIMGSKHFDHRSDIYSFGCVLYQMLTEIPPFDVEEGEGDTEYFVKDQHLRKPPQPPRELNPNIPEHIERVVLRCLEKKASDRFDSCREVMYALSETLAAKGPQRPPTVFEPQYAGAAEPFVSHASTPVTTNVQPPQPATYSTPPPTVAAPVPSAAATPAPAAAPVSTAKARGGSSRMVWVLGGLVAAAALAGGGFWYWRTDHPESKQVAENKPAPPVTNTQTTPASNTQTTTATPSAAAPPVKKPQAKLHPAVNSTAASPVATPQNPSQPVATPSANTSAQPAVPTPNPPPSPPASDASAQSGVLHCPGNPVSQNGEVVFSNLPNKRLKFTWDRAKWRIYMKNLPAGGRELVLVSLSPQVQTSCEVQWQVQP